MDNWSRYTREKVEQIIKTNSLYLLRKDDEVIGTVKISDGPPSFYNSQDMEKWADSRASAFYFTALAISPTHQGKGYGSILLQFVEDYAKEQKIPYLRMTMFSRNKPLADYYLRKGFAFPHERKVPELDLTLSFGEKRLS